MSGFDVIANDVKSAMPNEEQFRKDIEEVIDMDLRKDIRQQKKKATPIDFEFATRCYY